MLLVGLTAWTGCDRSEQAGLPPTTTTSAPSPPALFADVAGEVGIDFVHDSAADGQFYMPEITGSGAAWFDADNDGDLDAYLIQAGQWTPGAVDAKPNRFYRNEGSTFADATEFSGLGDPGYGMGCCVGDVDNDGDNDVYVTNVGANRLYLNDGQGRFTPQPDTSGVSDQGWGTSCAFVDYDRDGWLDLFVVNYLRWSPAFERPCHDFRGQRDYCAPTTYDAPARDILYHNRGDGTFDDVTESSGLDRGFGNGLGVVPGDFNDDGWIDLYVANDQTPNNLWLNQGDGTFIDDARIAGVDVNERGEAEASMGVDAKDIDDDGDLDLFMTHLVDETHTLYRNLGRARFEDHTYRLGIQKWSKPATGFGTLFLDVDHDGLLDLFVANGHVRLTPGMAVQHGNAYAQADQFIRQTAPGKFEDVSASAGAVFQQAFSGRGVAFGDYDNDGDIDCLINNNHGPAQLLRNDAPKIGHWLTVRAVTGKRDALGAVVRALGDEQVKRRDIRAAASYCASNDPRAHFTFGSRPGATRLVVRWPDGNQEVFDVPGLNRMQTLRQGTGSPP